MTYAILLVVHAALAPFIEDGAEFLLPLLVNSLLLWLLWAFANRRSGTLKWLAVYCSVAIVLLPVFALFADVYGSMEQLVQMLFLVEAGLCASILLVLRRTSTTVWFKGESAP